MFFPLVLEGREKQYKHAHHAGHPIDVDEMVLMYEPVREAAEGATLPPMAPPGNIDPVMFLTAVCKAHPAKDCDYEGWAEMGMALWHQTRGSELGLNMWIKWSSLNEEMHGIKISEDEMRETKWPSFNSGGRRGTTLRKILNTKKASGGRVIGAMFAALMGQLEDSKTLHEVAKDVRNDDFVGGNDLGITARAYKDAHNRLEQEQITIGEAKFALTDRPVSKDTADRFYDRYAYDQGSDRYVDVNNSNELTITGMNFKHGEEMPLTASGTRKAVHETLSKGFNGFRKPRLILNREYRPGEPALIPSGDDWILNTFMPNSWPISGSPLDMEDEIDREIVDHITNHMRLLAGGRDDIAWYLQQHLGWLRQKPSERIHVAYAISSMIQGVGKSTLKHLYATVLGAKNINTIYPANVSEKYNSFSGAPILMTFIEEFEFDSNRDRNKAMKSLKELITGDEVAVRKMNRDAFLTKASTCYAIFSNDSEVIGHEGSGRRWMPIEVDVISYEDMSKQLGVDYNLFFKNYYKLMDTYPDKFVRYFSDIDLSGFDTNRVTIETKEKQSYINSNPVNVVASFTKTLIESKSEDVREKVILESAIKKAIDADSSLDGDNELAWIADMKPASRNSVVTNALVSMGYVQLNQIRKRVRLPFASVDRPYVRNVWVKRGSLELGTDLDDNVKAIRDYLESPAEKRMKVVPINDDVSMENI